MKNKQLYIALCWCAVCIMSPIQAQQWRTHLAYNNVTQIAMSDEEVYAVSDGSLFSVNKQTEQIRVYNRQSGLNSSGITSIHYDNLSKQLFIGYATGKIDLLSARGVQYIGELYNKDMTQRKTIHNITIHGRTAYLSTPYGVQTFDLRSNRLVDSYWLRPNGLEIDIKDVLIANDSIYAFTTDSLFCAALTDNLVDYTYWRRELRTGRISPDTEKGKHYQDTYDHWYAGNAEGIVRFTPTSRLTYKPQGPLSNTPYRLTAANNNLWVVPGGRWADRYANPGYVMLFAGNQWTNINTDAIRTKPGEKVLDFLNVAVDPRDANHYFITSYGTGLYEFQGKQCIAHHLPAANNTLHSAVQGVDSLYTRVDYATYDSVHTLWMLNGGAVPYPLVCIDQYGEWHGLPLIVDNEPIALETPGGLVIDKQVPNQKWIAVARKSTALYLLDDNGTPFDASDDRAIGRNTWVSTKGHSFEPEFILCITQDRKGNIWMGTDQGVAIFDPTGYFDSDLCQRPELMDTNGENPMTELWVEAICQDKSGQIWVGTKTLGVYVLNEDATQITAHYTTENSALPANSILSLACDEQGIVYIGTGEGLAQYIPFAEKIYSWDNEKEEEDMQPGVMQQWRLHFSYYNPTEIVATPNYIFAIGNGSLYAVDRRSETIEYFDKSNGLTGSTIAHIAYDNASGQLIICYEDGRIDLLDQEGNITQMPDLFLKAGSMAVDIQCITVGKRHTYLGMSFGIVAINPRKAEVTETYYIGPEASSVPVQQIVEWGDSLYAFSDNRVFSAALTDNLVDYTFWKETALPCERVQQAVVFNNCLYTLQHDSLYMRQGNQWIQVVPNKLEWIHVSGGQLLTYQRNNGLLRLTEEHKLTGLTGAYVAADAIYSNGTYWLAEEGQGLVRLNSAGNDHFRPEGPMNNFGYRLHIAHDRLYVAPGGRWAEQFSRQSSLSIYDGLSWQGIPWKDTYQRLGRDMRDAVSYAVDLQDPGHFFVATYGTGVFEFKDYKAEKNYTPSNSTLQVAVPDAGQAYFTRTDGAAMDDNGNLWVLNATSNGYPVHVRTPNGIWYPLSLSQQRDTIRLITPGEIWFDRRDNAHKWIIDQREKPGIILFDDNGTPTISGDDRAVKRHTFIDQNGKSLTLDNIMCLTQDLDNRIWIGTNNGLIIIPTSVDFFSSNECRQIIVPRNDGTNDGDYLLGGEQINCMAIDGGNRMWIGTANSGLFLIEDDTITVARFTEDNSLLPSNTIQSIAIMPTTGEVFVGTNKGIASYRSDASAPREDLSQAYAFPNPIRPDYGGMISIAGLMEQTMVNIVDAGGNLVCKTRSHGGLAVWDGRLPDGQRAKSGVYTALCNEPNGETTVVKIVFIGK